jgi:hypothetical protein
MRVFQKRSAAASSKGQARLGRKLRNAFTTAAPPALAPAAEARPAPEPVARYGYRFADIALRRGETPPSREAENRTGLPDALKSGVEHLAGVPLDDVKVHYNSPMPSQIGALAHTQGTHIHVAPGQEGTLAHEAWHVVQQKQGRVKPTLRLRGREVNDDPGLEREAEAMGARVQTLRHRFLPLARAEALEAVTSASPQETGPAVIQRAKHAVKKKDMSTVERMRRANARAVMRLSSGGIMKAKHKFALRSAEKLADFEKNKATSSMTTPFGSVNLSKFPTKDPGAKITTVAKNYGKQKVGHKYSDLVDALGDKDSEVASSLLKSISSDKAPSTAVTSDLQKNAAAKMLAISHVSEERRVGGSSKAFRANLRMVKAGKVSMRAVFTGAKPLFPMAKNPKFMRKLLNLENKKQRKPPEKPDKFDDVAAYMSDSSDDEK